MTTIRLIEELSLNALPALQTLYYDGWLLRFAPGASGYPRRANSIQLIYPSTLPLEEKIAYCEAQYAARGQKTVFKLTLAAPDGLEAALHARGYVLDCTTSVQTLDLASIDPQPNPAEFVADPHLDEAWFSDFCRLSEDNRTRAAAMHAIFQQLAVETTFVRLCRDGRTVALGRAALDRGWLSVYEIVTDPEFRQQGIGTQLMLHLLQWGKQNGAHSAFLQVMTDNSPALRLYEKLGFREQYRYWYLQKSL